MLFLSFFLIRFIFLSVVIKNRDRDLFNRITSDRGHVLFDLLPPKRNRGHDFILPRVKTERFKRAFVKRCLLDLFLDVFFFFH